MNDYERKIREAQFMDRWAREGRNPESDVPVFKAIKAREHAFRLRQWLRQDVRFENKEVP